MKNNIIIASDGNRTELCINGKVYNDHITGVEFSHVCEKKKIEGPMLRIMVDTLPIEDSANVDDFKAFLMNLTEKI